LKFVVRYVDDAGDTQFIDVPKNAATPALPPRVGPGLVGYSASVPGCSRACALIGVDVQGLTGHGQLHVTEMSLGGQQLLNGADAPTPVRVTRSVRAVSFDGGLDLTLRDPYLTAPLLAWPRTTPPSALVTPGLRLEHAGRQPVAYGIDGRANPVAIAGEVPALPLLGRSGLLLDLGAALRGAGGQRPSFTTTAVVARADTPSTVLEDLKATGVTTGIRTVDQTLDRISRTETAKGTRLYLLIALFTLLLALVTVTSSVMEQRRDRRSEAASLRVIGVRPGQIAGGYRDEAWTLGVAAALTSWLAIWIACLSLLAALPLVQPGEFGLPFDPAPDRTVSLWLGAASGLFVALTVFMGFRRIGRTSPPRMLREES